METSPEEREENLSFQEECIREVLKKHDVDSMTFINDVVLFLHEFTVEVGPIIGAERFNEILDSIEPVYPFDVIAEIWIKVNEFENRF